VPAKDGRKDGTRDGIKVVATNRQARRNYEIIDALECGLVLTGSEVKSLREARVQLADAYARVIGSEVWLVGLHITPYSHTAGFSAPPAERDRKLLLHRDEIDRLRSRVDQDRLALVPLRLYFKDGRAKVELGVGRGRRQYDKRQVIAKRDADLEARRAMAQGRYAGRSQPRG
jgi:SsrA-binding protein